MERVVRIAIEAWDWNCPQQITPRVTLAELEPTLLPPRARTAELQQQLARARGT